MEVLTEEQILELKMVGYNPIKSKITLEDILLILPSELNERGHANLSLTAPDKKYKLKWGGGYRSDNPRELTHWFCEADTPIMAAFLTLKRFVAEKGTKLLNF